MELIMAGRVTGLITIVVSLLAGCSALRAADVPAGPGDPLPLAGRIEIGDLLKVSLFDYWGPDTVKTKRIRVARDGTIDPFYEAPVKVVGLTSAEVPKAIRAACVEHMIERGTWEDIQRLESGSHPSVRAGPVARGDLIEITLGDIYGPNTDISDHARVEEDGKIALPFAGMITVAGMEERDIVKAIVKAYRDANLIQHADVDVLKIETAEQSKVRLGPIGFGDLLHVTMEHVNGRDFVMAIDVRVGADGRAGIPGIGGIRLSGLTAAEAAIATEKASSGTLSKIGLAVLVEKTESADKASVKVGPIRIGDVVHVWLGGVPRVSSVYQENYRVDDSGDIRLPYMGQVHMAGLTELGAQEAVEKECKVAASQGTGYSQPPFVSILRVFCATDKAPTTQP
jgi:protein involved in polysaccharide export with SLBB domain